MTPSFKSYVVKAKAFDTLAGDFIGDAKLDKALPNAKTWDELESYLLLRWGTEPIAAAQAAWRNYEIFRRRAAN